jgi:hypothetical protein
MKDEFRVLIEQKKKEKKYSIIGYELFQIKMNIEKLIEEEIDLYTDDWSEELVDMLAMLHSKLSSMPNVKDGYDW